MTLNNSMSITPSPPGQAKGAKFEHGSVLGGKTRGARVSSQWKSTLESRNARLPDNKRTAVEFVRDLIRKTPAKPVIACSCPGWTPDGTGFIMPRRRYGNAKVDYIWDSKEVPPQFGEIKG